MIQKKKLLKNLQQYSASEIAEAVRNGVVTIYELEKGTEGAFTPLLRKRVETILAAPPEPAVEPQPQSAPTHPVAVEPPVAPVAPVAEPAAEPQPQSAPADHAEPQTDSKGMFRNPFSFKGRIRRLEYGLSFIIYFVFIVISQIVSDDIIYKYAYGDVSSAEYQGYLTILLIISIPFYWFFIAQNCKRCHDVGHSGWSQLIPFYVFALLFERGTIGDNKYGKNPKE